MKLPATLPRVNQILDRDDAVDTMAAYLDLSTKTIKAYRDTNKAPMAAHWAMYWISPWGQQWLQCEFGLGNELLHAQVRSLQSQVGALRAYVARIEHVNDGAANAPAFDPSAWGGFKGISCSRPIGSEPAGRSSPLRLAGSIAGSSPLARGAET